ncbi:MAG: hypothetical protein EB145_18270 [Proteobacteria bacterium]|nr:hypothetical protein [Pseudomonadota bacterium]
MTVQSNLQATNPVLFDLAVVTLAIAAGFIGSLIGLGGGALLVPGLVMFLGVPMKIAMNLTRPERVTVYNRDKLYRFVQNGADVFLVPKSQTAEEIASARAAVGSSLTIIPVGTLDEALAALKKYGGGSLPAS